MGSIINPNEKQTWAITAQGITVMGKTKSYNTYEEMLRSPDPGLINYVTDASGDPTVHSGFAVYRYSNGIFTKIYEGEMMDPDLGMVFEWSKIVNGPTSTPTDIDAAVEKTQPMEIQKDDTGRVVGLAVNGILLATEEQITELEGKTAGALHFKGVVENKEALPTEGNAQGDVYVDKAGKEYVYVDGTGFEEFGSITDLTNYYTKNEITSILATYLPLTNGVFSGLVYMEEAATSNAAQNIIVLGSNAIMNRISIGQQDPTGFDADKLYSFKYFEAGPLGMKGFVDYLKSKGVSEAITSAIRTNGVQIQDTGKKISDIPFYQTFQNSNDDAPRKTIQLANHDTISGITTAGTGVNIAMVSKWDKVDLGSASIQLNLNSSDRPTLNDEDPIVVQSDLADYAKFEPNTSDPSRPDRKVLTLKNDDNICGCTTAGGSVNIAMVSKWDVADFGSTSVHMNLNSKDAITVNDKDTVLTDANYSEFITIPSLEGLATEESVQAQIAQEVEDRQAADSSLTAAIGLKQNALTVDGQKLILTDDVLELGADVVVMQNPWDPDLPNRRHIVLKNHDSIVGTMTTGDNGSLIMMSKWDKVDIGTTKAQMNLNSPNGVIQVNDDAVVVTSANIGEYVPITDLSNYYTKVEVDQKIAGVLTYKGVLATVEELQSVEAPATGWVYHITATGSEYAYNGSEWEELGSEVDLSAYAKTEDVTTAIEAAKSDLEAKIDANKVNLGEGNPNMFVITNNDGTIKASGYKMGGASFAADPTANTAATELAVKTAVDGKVDKVEGKSLVDDAEIARLSGVTNYDDTEVKAAIALKQDKLAGSEYVTVDNNIVSLTDMVVNYAYDETHTRKHIVLANHNSIVGTLVDGSNNVNLVMLSKWDKVDFGSTQVTMNLNTKDHVTINDKDVIVTDKDLAVVSGNVVSIKDRLVALEAQIVSLKQTDVAAVTAAADLSQADKDLIITIAEPISGTTTVEGKSIEVKQLTTNNATTIFKTAGDVTMKNLNTTGDLPKATANAQIRIVSGEYVRITDSAINQTGYNAVEIGLGTGSGPSATKSIVIDNVKFNSTLTNNAISIFATEDGSVITISNCTFTKCSNPVRLSNATGGKVTINLVNCEFTEWDSNPDWAGILIMQDYTSGSEEAIQSNNLFGPDKVTINVINCTHNGQKIVAPENIASVCGTKDQSTQLFYIWSNEEGFVAYDAERYPVINIQ